MAITHLILRNYRSFRHLDLRLDSFTVVVGANSSGKSNLVSAIRFLVLAGQGGLAHAIRLNGGFRGIINARASHPEVVFEVTTVNRTDFETGVSISRSNKTVRSQAWATARYRLRIKVLTNPNRAKVVSENLLVTYTRGSGKVTSGKPQTNAEVIGGIELARRRSRIEYRTVGGAALPPTLTNGMRILQSLPELPLGESVTMLEYPITRPLVGASLPDVFSSAFYDLEPKKERDESVPLGAPVLRVDGANLAYVVQAILEDPERKSRFVHLIQNYLPFVRDIRVSEIGNLLQLGVRERGSGVRYFPPANVSDGTLNVISLVALMHFERRPLIVVEEVERGIHPKLFSKLVEGLRALSEEEQVILTTHNPEVVRYAGLENLVLLSRGKSGDTLATRPRDSQRVRDFLKNDLGVSDLFITDQLG